MKIKTKTPNKKLKKILDEAEKNRNNPEYWGFCNSINNLMISLKRHTKKAPKHLAQ